MGVPSVLAVETAALTAWPGLHTAYDGHWVWRAARGYSNRANSIQCLDAGDGANAAERIARFSEMFTRHGLTPAFKVSPLVAPEITATLDELGWGYVDASVAYTNFLQDAAVDGYWTPSVGFGFKFNDASGLRIAYEGDFANNYTSNGGTIQLYFGY